MIFIRISFVTRERDRWCVLKRKEKRKKYIRMPFSRESHLYTGQLRMKHQKWHWVGYLIPLLSLTYIALYIPIGGNHIFRTFVIPHTTLGQSNFIRTLLLHFFFHLTKTSNPSHKSHHFPCTYKLGQLQSPFPFVKSPLHYPYCLLNEVVYTLLT